MRKPYLKGSDGPSQVRGALRDGSGTRARQDECFEFLPEAFRGDIGVDVAQGLQDIFEIPDDLVQISLKYTADKMTHF